MSGPAAGALVAAEPPRRVPATSPAALDTAVGTLAARRSAWASLPLLERIELLRRLRRSFAGVAEEWVRAVVAGEGMKPSDPAAGEEWISGPFFVLRNLRLLERTLRNLSVHGSPRLPGPVRTLPNGQVAARVFPLEAWDRVFYPGVTAEVWMRPGVTEESLPDTLAVAYREKNPRGEVALVLSAGNVSSIGPMDALYQLFVENRVVVYKAHPVNEYLGPLLERGLRPLVEAGFLRVVYGGAAEGRHLAEHPRVDAIHITGSDKTYEAIVFGSGEAGRKRLAARRPLLEKPVSAELGNVSPVIVVPGPWSPREIAYHAENITTMLAHNAGFNCNAARVLVTWEGWPQREELLAGVRDQLRRLPLRHAWYPGAEERWRMFHDAHPEAETFGEPEPGQLPWTFVPGLDPAAEDEICFTTESFASVFGETALPAADAAAFVAAATDFCNQRLWGSLNVTLLVPPAARDDEKTGPALERAVAELRYGSVSLNHWAAIGYGLVVTPWGAFPGHPPHDIRSGSGVVHNTLMLSEVEKNVVSAPFTVWPKPPWFVTHARSWEIGEKLTRFEADPALWRLPGIFRSGLAG